MPSTFIFAETNPIVYILVAWLGIFIFFAVISFGLWIVGNRKKKELLINPEYQLFKQIEIHVVSKSKLSYNFSIPSKIDVLVGKDEVHFLPGKFNIFLLTKLVPSSVKSVSTNVHAEMQFSKSIQLKFNSDALQAFFKPFYLLRTDFECTLTCINEQQRQDFFSKLNVFRVEG